MLFPSFTMYDSVTVPAIPSDAKAVAGYVDGLWPTFHVLERTHPHALRLSIAVTAAADAGCLDIEKGDATADQAPAWVRRQHARGVRRPVLYTSLSNVRPLLELLAVHGVSRRQVKLWTAHYTGRSHRCTPACGSGMPTVADATQWTNTALGRNLDASLCAWSFIRRPAPRPSRPAWLRFGHI